VSDIHHDIGRFTMSNIMHREVEGLYRTVESSHRHWTKKGGRSKESWFEKTEKLENISLTAAEYLIENPLTRYEYDVQL
jgi:hypothetical protein